MLSRSQQSRLVRKLNKPALVEDQTTWLSEDDRFDMIEDRLDEIGDVLSDCRIMLRKLLDK